MLYCDYIKRAVPGAIAIVLVIIMLLIASCQEQAPAPAPQPAPGSTVNEVTIEGFAFRPATITIPAGTTLTWTNKDSAPHTVTSRVTLFDSGTISRNETFSYTFEQSGTFDYYCTIHPRMTAKVIVE